MDILTSIPVQVSGPESISCVVNNVKERIARRAYESFVERGSVHGHELDDWLNAERELIIKPVPVVRVHGADIFVEMLLPEMDLPNLTVHVAPSQLVISSDPDEEGLQLCQMIDLPCEISLDGVDAEQLHHTLHVTAAVAQSQPEPA
jgi:HSP20 family molecular chaperone IbpA